MRGVTGYGFHGFHHGGVGAHGIRGFHGDTWVVSPAFWIIQYPTPLHPPTLEKSCKILLHRNSSEGMISVKTYLQGAFNSKNTLSRILPQNIPSQGGVWKVTNSRDPVAPPLSDVTRSREICANHVAGVRSRGGGGQFAPSKTALFFSSRGCVLAPGIPGET